MDFFRVVTKQTLDVLKKIGLFSCYHRKRVVTKQTLDVRNSCLLPWGLSTFVPRVFFLRKKNGLFFVTTGNGWPQTDS